MSKQPPGWVTATLADVTEYISRGKSPKYTHHSILPVVNQRAIRWFGIQQEHLKYVDPAQFDLWTPERFIRIGDVLWNSTGTGTIGRACLVTQHDVEPPKVVDSHVTIVRPNQAVIEPRFLFSWIQSPEIQENISSLATGTTNQIELSRLAIASIQIPIAPLNEQKRIADKLNALLARVDACRERLDRIPSILKRFRQAVLAAATSGQLTEDWRDIHSTNKMARWVSLEDVASEFSYGSSAKSSPSGSVPVLRMGNLQEGKLDWQDLVFTSDTKEIEKYRLLTGDVLFNRTNSPELVGKTAVYKGERPAIYAGYLIRVRCRADLLSDYLNYCLNSPAGRDYCWRVKSDAISQSNINARKLAAFEFELPPVEEQAEIVRRCEALFAFADRLEARYKKARAQVERLTPVLLAKAFRGELVPQDPNDEPASVLLDRIRAERAAQPPKPKRPQASRKQTMTKMTEESVKEAIRQLPKDEFSFDELRDNLPGDYDSLKDILFALLSEAEPSLTQVFDREERAICFVRAGK
ncbi:restriction endonuclease subunit S [Microcoleus sp. A003_D6]|uniref:restriction endonuclease subunit S n=1 Tax=Microcoleus sp. A003_D6 TaxID=3055266 RepID=UPI002FD1111D